MVRFRFHAIVIGVVTLSMFTSGLRAADDVLLWPQFRGATGQGVGIAKGLPANWSENENIVWRTELPGAGTSSPIIVGSNIILTCYTGYNVPGAGRGSQDDLKLHLLCIERDTGKVQWTVDIAPKLPEQDRIRDDHGYASSTPACDGERLYCFFGKTGVIAFDLKGKELWRAVVGDRLHGWGSGNSPVVHNDLVYINASVESDSLVALDKKSGREKWRARGIRESWNSPIFVKNPEGKIELVIAVFGKILGFDPHSGEQLWSCATDIGWYMVPSLVAADGVVYAIGGRTGGALAVRTGGSGDVTRSHRVWTGKKGSNVSSPILHEGHLYWMHEGLGIAFCAEAKTGRVVYEERIPGADQVYASPVLADGKLFYVSRTGRGIVIEAKPEFSLLSTNRLGQRTTFNASPAVAGNRLFIRSDKHLYCIGAK
jgi:outer membrane protein assembly factor BamB